MKLIEISVDTFYASILDYVCYHSIVNKIVREIYEASEKAGVVVELFSRNLYMKLYIATLRA